MDKLCFVAVEFVDDPNVAGYTYWYYCDIGGAAEGDKVSAPLGRHNHIQEGMVRKVIYTDEAHSPYPFAFIKKVQKVFKENGDV